MKYVVVLLTVSCVNIMNVEAIMEAIKTQYKVMVGLVFDFDSDGSKSDL